MSQTTTGFHLGARAGFQISRRGLPAWFLIGLVLLFLPTIWVHEAVFGSWVGLRAAAAGVAAGLFVAWASSFWRWDWLSTIAGLIAAHFLIGGVAAYPSTTFYGLPTPRTLQLLVLQVVYAWKDLLTITPPASAYVGPSMVPWLSGLLCSFISALLVLRAGRAIAAVIPVALMGVMGIAWGKGGTFPNIWLIAAWWALALGWCAWADQYRRLEAGLDVRVGGAAASDTSATLGETTQGGSQGSIHLGRQIAGGALVIAVVAAAAIPLTNAYGPWYTRVVLRDVVQPPLDARQYPSPLSAFRHYNVDLQEQNLIHVDGLPEGARVRIGVMDSYDGTTMTMSAPGTGPSDGFIHVGSTLPQQQAPEGSSSAHMTFTTSQLLGPWVPIVGTPSTMNFDQSASASGTQANQQEGNPNAAVVSTLSDGLYYDMWANAALATSKNIQGGTMVYSMDSTVVPIWSDGQLSGTRAVPYRGGDKGVPDSVRDLATQTSAAEQGDLAKARAIERYLKEKGFYSNEDNAQSRPGNRADRLSRMLEAEQMIGDDEQYSVLMALMLHNLGMNARVIMGAYPNESKGGDVDLRGSDVHAWVEVEFQGVGWAVFDPTPPRDQVPQTDVPKPRSVPRPQVLQPPEPPEQPAELPPTTTDRGSDSNDDSHLKIPWRIIATGSGILAIIAIPLLAIVLAKSRRTKKRRWSAPPQALTGSWDEVVDLARDAGVVVPTDLTRQEAAWMLTTSPLWPASAAKSSTSTPQWYEFGEELPKPVRVARWADTADFSGDEVQPEQATDSWQIVDELTQELRENATRWTRIRRALSLSSLSARYRQKHGASPMGVLRRRLRHPFRGKQS